MSFAATSWPAYLRQDGRKGIRNVVAIVYLVECAHHVAREIAAPFADAGAQTIGFPGCYPNVYATNMLASLCTHPNVGAALLVSLGCESFPRADLEALVAASGRPVRTIVIQESGGTRGAIEAGRGWLSEQLALGRDAPRTTMSAEDLIVGTICAGSDGTSGLTANAAVGRAFELLVAEGAGCIFEETVEMVGCREELAARAVTSDLGAALRAAVDKAARYSSAMGWPSFASGNASGGLTTIEEKSLGAYAKSGRGPIHGLLKPCDTPSRGGLYLLDVVPDGAVRWGFPNINDSTEIAELISCGAHMILLTTGRGSVVGSAISPVLKICANPETYARMSDDMDVNAGRILEGDATVDAVAREICDLTMLVAAGEPTRAEALGHQEFILGYKSFEPAGPACHPDFVPLQPFRGRLAAPA